MLEEQNIGESIFSIQKLTSNFTFSLLGLKYFSFVSRKSLFLLVQCVKFN